jgi:hypothetical protein
MQEGFEKDISGDYGSKGHRDQGPHVDGDINLDDTIDRHNGEMKRAALLAAMNTCSWGVEHDAMQHAHDNILVVDTEPQYPRVIASTRIS